MIGSLLREVRCYVDGHLTGQHVALLPGGHQVAAASWPRRSRWLREATTATAASLTPPPSTESGEQAVPRCHGAGAGDTGSSAPTADAHSVFEGETRRRPPRPWTRPAKWPITRAGRYAVGLHCGRQRDLHGKQVGCTGRCRSRPREAVMASVSEEPDLRRSVVRSRR